MPRTSRVIKNPTPPWRQPTNRHNSTTPTLSKGDSAKSTQTWYQSTDRHNSTSRRSKVDLAIARLCHDAFNVPHTPDPSVPIRPNSNHKKKNEKVAIHQNIQESLNESLGIDDASIRQFLNFLLTKSTPKKLPAICPTNREIYRISCLSSQEILALWKTFKSRPNHDEAIIEHSQQWIIKKIQKTLMNHHKIVDDNISKFSTFVLNNNPNIKEKILEKCLPENYMFNQWHLFKKKSVSHLITNEMPRKIFATTPHHNQSWRKKLLSKKEDEKLNFLTFVSNTNPNLIDDLFVQKRNIIYSQQKTKLNECWHSFIKSRVSSNLKKILSSDNDSLINSQNQDVIISNFINYLLNISALYKNQTEMYQRLILTDFTDIESTSSTLLAPSDYYRLHESIIKDAFKNFITEEIHKEDASLPSNPPDTYFSIDLPPLPETTTYSVEGILKALNPFNWF
jgi:hypothetical protein